MSGRAVRILYVSDSEPMREIVFLPASIAFSDGTITLADLPRPKGWYLCAYNLTSQRYEYFALANIRNWRPHPADDGPGTEGGPPDSPPAPYDKPA
jgi:hypothetical protein